MKFYLASRYRRFPEMQEIRADLEKLGHSVTCRWINGDHQISDDGLSPEGNEAERIRFAMEDIADLRAADMLVAFTEPPRSKFSRG